MPKVLLVEDDAGLRSLTKKYLQDKSYLVEDTGDGQEAVHILRVSSFDAIVLDWELPGLTGAEICRRFRAHGGKTPIIMLTGRSALADKSAGFGAGADDYLTKPFEMEELHLRLESVIRRASGMLDPTLRVGELEFDTRSKKLFQKGSEVQLLPKEVAIIEFLMRNPSQVFSAEQLLSSVWPTSADVSTEAVTACIGRLRKKLVSDKPIIATVYGMGYRLESD